MTRFHGAGFPGSGFVKIPLAFAAGGEDNEVEGQGMLRGYSSNGNAASEPAPLTFEFLESAALSDAFSGGISFDFAYGIGGASIAKFWVSNSDPLSDYTFVDVSGASSEEDMVTALASAIDAALLGLYCGTAGRTLTVGLSETGSAVTLGCTVGNMASNVIQGGGGSGGDGTDPSGNVTEVEVLPAPEAGAITVDEVSWVAGAQGFDLPNDDGWEVGWYDGLGAWVQVMAGGDLAPLESGGTTELASATLEAETPLMARYTGEAPVENSGQPSLTISAVGRVF
jgi:hypothetical protein